MTMQGVNAMHQNIGINIQSFGDIITNSSSEVFCTISAEKDVCEFIYEILSGILPTDGDSEIHPVVDYRKKEDEDKIWYSEEEWNNLPEAWIDITMPYGSGHEDCDTFYRAGLEAVLKTHNIPGNYTIDFL